MHLMRFFQAPGLVGMRKQKQENKKKQPKKNLLKLENVSDTFLWPNVGVVGKKKGKWPLHLVFQAREGLMVVLWVGNKKNGPSILCFKRGRGWWLGGGVVGQKMGKRPLCIAFQAREGLVVMLWCCGWNGPSVSHFKRGRGQWWLFVMEVVVLLGPFSRNNKNETHLGTNDKTMFRCLAHLTSTSSSSPFHVLLSIIIWPFGDTWLDEASVWWQTRVEVVVRAWETLRSWQSHITMWHNEKSWKKNKKKSV